MLPAKTALNLRDRSETDSIPAHIPVVAHFVASVKLGNRQPSLHGVTP